MGTHAQVPNNLLDGLSQPAASLAPHDAERLRLAEEGAPPSAQAPAAVRETEGHDEWGFYDPDQCGVGAVIARIGGTASPEPDEQKRRAEALRLDLDDD